MLRGGFSCRRSKTIDGDLMKKVVVGAKEASHKQAPMNDAKNVKLGFFQLVILPLLPNLSVSSMIDCLKFFLEIVAFP